ncbi:MAG: hypothetical protein QM811_21230 [Pirellulales bacterium]
MPRFALDDALALITTTRPTMHARRADHVHRHAQSSEAARASTCRR